MSCIRSRGPILDYMLSERRELTMVVNSSVNACLECKKLESRGVIFVPQVRESQFSYEGKQRNIPL